MPRRCKSISCLCELKRIIVPDRTYETCNKPFYQEKMTLVKDNRELCICLAENFKNKETNDESEVNIENTEMVDRTEKVYVQKPETNQEIQSKIEGQDVAESIEENESTHMLHVDGSNGMKQVIEQTVVGGDTVTVKDLVAVREGKDKVPVNESITNQQSERNFANAEVDDIAKSLDECKLSIAAEETETNQIIQRRNISDEKSGTQQEIEIKTDVARASYNEVANEEMKIVNKEIWSTILKLKRIKDKIENIHRAIDELKDDQRKITDKIAVIISPKNNDADEMRKSFDKFQKYYNRIKSMLNNIPKLTNKVQKMTNKVEIVTAELRVLASKLHETTVQFRKSSLDSQNVSIEFVVNAKTCSDTDERSLIRKMLKICDKMQKNLVYCNDSLLKSK